MEVTWSSDPDVEEIDERTVTADDTEGGVAGTGEVPGEDDRVL